MTKKKALTRKKAVTRKVDRIGAYPSSRKISTIESEKTPQQNHYFENYEEGYF
jgi:hypothetical protein